MMLIKKHNIELHRQSDGFVPTSQFIEPRSATLIFNRFYFLKCSGLFSNELNLTISEKNSLNKLSKLNITALKYQSTVRFVMK